MFRRIQPSQKNSANVNDHDEIQSLPTRPGCYAVIRDKQVLYVGASSDLRERCYRFIGKGKRADRRYFWIWRYFKTSPQFTTTITRCLPPVALSCNHQFQPSSYWIFSFERIADEERTKCRRKITVRNVLIADIDADQTCNACPEFAVLTFKLLICTQN